MTRIEENVELKILIVDDDLVDREMVIRLLRKLSCHCQIFEAKTVDEGLLLFDDNVFDVILLDYRMPQRNGIEMILELKTHVRNYGSAIVMMSSAENEELITECLKSGAQDFIPKADITLERLQSAITHAQTRFSLEQELRKNYLASKELAETDCLTGIANRFVFEESLAIAMVNNARSQHHLGLILFDIDDFKLVNDNYGHDIGDEVLKSIARRVAGVLRGHELFARIGGDEFAIMLANVKEVFQFSEITTRILSLFDDPLLINDLSLTIQLSIGAAVHPNNEMTSKELVKCCDIALYRAKKTDGNKVCFFYPEMQQKCSRSHKIERALESAVEQGRLEMVYQPMVELESGLWRGFEASFKLKVSDTDFALPEEFMPIAERSELSMALGDWMMDAGLHQLKQWQKELSIGLSLSMNLSITQLASPALIAKMQSHIEKNDLIPSRLELTIKESDLIRAEPAIIQRILCLRELGLKVVLSGFGSGHVSVPQLLEFPISGVKLAPQVVPKLGSSSKCYLLVETLISTAKKLELEIFSDGIEEEFQNNFMKENGVVLGQGSYFCEPKSKEELVQEYFKHH